jgi:hypothetical protein
MPRRIREVVGSVLALMALVAVLVCVDERARVRVDRFVNDLPETTWSQPQSAIDGAIAYVAGDTRFGNVFLISFIGAAALLVVLMLRT